MKHLKEDEMGALIHYIHHSNEGVRKEVYSFMNQK
jgi:hypothetical protein